MCVRWFVVREGGALLLLPLCVSLHCACWVCFECFREGEVRQGSWLPRLLGMQVLVCVCVCVRVGSPGGCVWGRHVATAAWPCLTT